MKIFLVSFFGNGGAEYTLADALRAAGHEARSARWAMNYLDFPVDVLCPTDDILAGLWSWADVVVCLDFGEPPVTAIRRPLVKVYTGTGYRENFQQFDVIDARIGAVAAAVTIDLCRDGVAWLPLPVPDLSKDWEPAPDEFRVIHAPTSRVVKRTDWVIAELGNVPGVTLEIVEGVTNVECLRRKARGHVFVDQFDLGYGTNAVEAWAFGQPVVANGADWILERMRREWGQLPFVQPEPSLRVAIEMLRDNPKLCRGIAQMGREHWRRYHAPAAVGARLAGLCEEAIERMKVEG